MIDIQSLKDHVFDVLGAMRKVMKSLDPDSMNTVIKKD